MSTDEGDVVISLPLLSFSSLSQVDLYNHLEQEEMNKVREQVKTKRTWLETQMQACQIIKKHVTAPVTSAQIMAEAKVQIVTA